MVVVVGASVIVVLIKMVLELSSLPFVGMFWVTAVVVGTVVVVVDAVVVGVIVEVLGGIVSLLVPFSSSGSMSHISGAQIFK